MIPEFGQFALILALCLALVQGVMPILGAARGNRAWMALARPAAVGQCVFVIAAFAVLAHAFLADDFSVRYVAAHSNSTLPVFYKFAAVWGGHEGSMLLWITVLGAWTMAAVWSSRHLPEDFASRVIGVLGIVSAGMISFTLLTSNPFERLHQVVVDGNALNPLLQNPAMVMHPPMLYMGYVGLSVPFAFAIAALLTGRMTPEWAKWTRPWVIASWMFLTVGIALGSWWAYYELGWGGWWFWDPVENSSFMPWLMATALMHSLAVTERRGIFKSWTVLLAIAAFALSLIGTFLTRSGVLVSVHAFATDPTRGRYILMLLGAICGSSLLLYAFRAKHMTVKGGFKLMSREAFLLANNVLLVVAAGLILFGTLYPLFVSAFGGKLSVGAPYFDAVFLLPILPLIFLLGVGMHTFWKSTSPQGVFRKLRWLALFAVVGGITVPLLVFGHASVISTVAVIAGVWVCLSALYEPARRLVVGRSAALSRAQWGMVVAHLGVGLFMLGATITSTYNLAKDSPIKVGDTLTAGGYDFTFLGTRQVTGPNYRADEGTIEVHRNGELVTVLKPQKRVYDVQQNPMTEAAITGGPGRDIFAALGEPLGNQTWSVRIQIKPMIRFLWFGALVMAFGGLLAASDRRYWQRARSRQSESIQEPVTASQAVEGN